MTALADLTLLRPAWLLALPVLALIAVVLRRRRAGLGDWEKVVEPAMMAALQALGRVDGGRAAGGMVALSAAAIVSLALAGPAVQRRDAAAYRNLDGVVFVVDSSPSMTESDRWPALLTMGRFGIAALGTRPAGLIVFAGDAYVATDMTGDTAQLGQTLSLIDTQTVPDPGSRPALGLSQAVRMLSEAEVLAGDIVLMTDGAGIGPETLTEAAAIAGQGARLSVVATRPDDPAVATLAAAGGGRVFGLGQADALTDFLRQSSRQRLERQDYPLLFWSDLGRYLIFAALLPVLLLFRRRAA